MMTSLQNSQYLVPGSNPSRWTVFAHVREVGYVTLDFEEALKKSAFLRSPK